MKKLIPTLAVLGSAVAFAIYKLKKDEQKQLMELDQDLLVDDNEDTDEIIHLQPKQMTPNKKSEAPKRSVKPSFTEPVMESMKKGIKEIKDEAKEFHADMLNKASDIKEDLLEKTKDVKEEFKKASEDIVDEAEDIKEDLREKVNVIKDDIKEEVNESVYHEEKLAEALQSLKEQVEEPDSTDEIRQAIKEAISEGQPELPKEEPEIKEETPFAYSAPEEETTTTEEEEEDDDYNEDYPHLTNTLVEDINQMTQEAMDSLESDGDVHEHERPVQHMVSFTNMNDLDNFKNKVINKGFVITKGEGDMDLVVLHISPIDKVKLVSNILYLADQAYANNGEYKGWQSKVSY